MANEHKRGGQERSTTDRQKEGYDEAAHGGKNVPPSDVGVPPNPGEEIGGTPDDRAAREAANDVRRQDKSGS